MLQKKWITLSENFFEKAFLKYNYLYVYTLHNYKFFEYKKKCIRVWSLNLAAKIRKIWEQSLVKYSLGTDKELTMLSTLDEVAEAFYNKDLYYFCSF